jgi:hypothetical protein
MFLDACVVGQFKLTIEGYKLLGNLTLFFDQKNSHNLQLLCLDHQHLFIVMDYQYIL